MKIQCPPYLIVKANEKIDVSTLRKAGLKFPLVLKQLEACGSSSSHLMSIIFREADLSLFQKEKGNDTIVIQQYYNHHDTLFKIFVIGNHHFTIHRPSLPDFPTDINWLENAPIMSFDSQALNKLKQLYQSTLISILPPIASPRSSAFLHSPPPSETISALAHGISSHLGVTIFGLDLIPCFF